MPPHPGASAFPVAPWAGPPRGAEELSASARRYRLAALKRLARHLDGLLNDIWTEIVDLEEEEEEAG
jgi:hypothetical protein